MKALHADYAEGQKKNRAEAPKVQKEISRIELAMDRIVTAITTAARPAIVTKLTEELEDVRLERVKEQKRVIEADTNVVTFLPDAVATYMRAVDDLHTALVNDPTAEEARGGFRTFIDRIIIHPLDGHTAVPGLKRGFEFALYGRLGALGVTLFPKGRSHQKILADQGVDPCAIVKKGKTYRTRVENGMVVIEA